jgi:hypothetical protein
VYIGYIAHSVPWPFWRTACHHIETNGHLVGFLGHGGWGGVGGIGQHNTEERGHTSITRMGFEPTIPGFERGHLATKRKASLCK